MKRWRDLHHKRHDGIPIVGQRQTPKVVLGYPTGPNVTTHFAQSLVRLIKYEGDKGEKDTLLASLIPQMGFFIEDNRIGIADRFLYDTDADWLLMIDSDIQYPPQIVEMMLAAAAVADDRKIVAASVPLGPPLPSCGLYMTDNPGGWAYLGADDIDELGTEVHGIAMPCWMAHREVYEKIAENIGRAWFYRKRVPRMDEERSRKAWEGEGPTKDRAFINQGEDLAFCLNAMDAGFKLFVYKMPGLKHYKTTAYSHDEEPKAAMPVLQEGA